MAREFEKLRAEMANAEKRAHATATVGNQGMHSSRFINMQMLALNSRNVFLPRVLLFSQMEMIFFFISKVNSCPIRWRIFLYGRRIFP